MKPLRLVRLDGPPLERFDCGRTEQNEHLHLRAWGDQQQLLSTTYVVHHSGLPAGYVTVCMDSIPLSRKERGISIPYQQVSAMKLAQLGIDERFQGLGLGTDSVGIVVNLAHRVGKHVGCRYLTLDAQKDLVPWYESLGFKRNELRQQQRIADALLHRRDPATIPISMRYDLREAA
jgi:GNAT superfamily N-acetyltransferase